MKPSRNWIVVLAVVAALIGIRAFSGQGMGRVFVKAEPITVQVAADARMGTPAQSVSWTRWSAVPAKAYFAAERANPQQTEIQFSWARTMGLWLAAFLTLAIFSFMYRDNPAYRFAEAAIVGVSAAYWMTIGFWDTIVPKLLGSVWPNFVKANILPSLAEQSTVQVVAMWAALVLGIMLLMRLSSKGAWISMWPLAFIIGVTAGLKIVSHVESDLLQQSVATFKPLLALERGADGAVAMAPTVWLSLRNVLIVVGVLSCLTYFFFSVEHKGLVGRSARVGVWYLMITFGAAFGFTVMGRVALLAARVEFLFDDWLWLIDPSGKRVVETVSMLVG